MHNFVEHGIVSFTCARDDISTAEIHVCDFDGNLPADPRQRETLTLPLDWGLLAHLSDHGHAIGFNSAPNTTDPGYDSLRQPPVGMRVRFQRDPLPTRSTNGLDIISWTPHWPLLELQTKLAQRKTYRLYIGTRCVWEGQDLRELSTLYQRWDDHLINPSNTADYDVLQGISHHFEVYTRTKKGKRFMRSHDPRLPVCCISRAFIVKTLKQHDRPTYQIGACRHQPVSTR